MLAGEPPPGRARCDCEALRCAGLARSGCAGESLSELRTVRGESRRAWNPGAGGVSGRDHNTSLMCIQSVEGGRW